MCRPMLRLIQQLNIDKLLTEPVRKFLRSPHESLAIGGSDCHFALSPGLNPYLR
jgi:hypothetical protein